MMNELKMIVLVAALLVPATALGGVITVTEFTPTGVQEGIVEITAVTAGQVYSAPDLVGAVAVEQVGLNSSLSVNHPGVASVEDTLIGLDAGSAALGLGSSSANKMAAWFADPISGDGDSATPEILLVDWGASLDNYEVQLLTSDAAAGIAGAVVATAVQVVRADQVQTTTVIDSATWGPIQNLAGVGIDLDSEGLAEGTQILGVMVLADDGLGTGALTGFDPTIVATIVPEPSTLALLVLALGLGSLTGRRRRS
jgi:hypothetical protein